MPIRYAQLIPHGARGFTLTQASDQPVEILVVETSKARKINDEIAKRFGGANCRIVPLARKYFE